MNVQTEYYIRLLLLLVQGGMLVCKGIAERELAGITLDIILKPHEPKLKNKLIKSQYIVLFPKSGNPDVEDLDLSLLTVVLLDTMVLSTNDIQYIKIIKETRNTLSHNSTASVEVVDYNTLKTDLEDALTKLCLGLDLTVKTECSKLIQKFTSEPLDEVTALKYVKELRNEDELLQDFEGMLEKQSENIVQEIKASENRMQESLSDFKLEVMGGIQNLHTGYSDDFTHYNFPDTLPDCDVCSHGENTRTGASYYCEVCCQFMCSECSQLIHTEDSITNLHKRHRLVEGKPLRIDLKGYDMCDIHKKKLLYVCESDNQLCCEVCYKESHEHCPKITSISDETCESEHNPAMEIPRLQSETRLLIEWMSYIERDVNRNVENIPARLDEHRKALLKLFDDEAQKLKEKATAMKDNTVREIKKNRKKCEDVIQKTEQAKQSLMSMTKCGATSQKVIAQYRIKAFTNEFKSLTDVSFVSVCLDNLKLPGHSSLHSELLPVQVEVPGTRPVQLFLIGVLELKQDNNEKKQPFYTGLDYLPDGRLVVVDNFNKKCLIFNEKLEKVGSYQLSFTPQSVVAVSEEEVAITSDKIYFLHVSKSNEMTLNRSCKVTTKYHSISMIDDRNFVVGTINDTRPVRIVSLAGEEGDFGISFPDKKYDLDSSACTYMRNSKKVVHSDRFEHTVFMYDITTDTRVAVKDDNIKEPKGVAVGPFDCIFVCSKETNSIVQISPTGHIVASHKIDLEFPYSICFSKDKTRLAVSNSALGKIVSQIFKVKI